ncbi:protein of unknown function [Sterolibacterium denitrificans]|uniref:Uncharacterized protein n=1 Tax=Sterolibacterium denitrificans TaxID=157592 RepID=A0A7Z7MUS6_9PROT|nr:protein of unknown function [Sterolibacterium denitrificans]
MKRWKAANSRISTNPPRNGPRNGIHAPMRTVCTVRRHPFRQLIANSYQPHSNNQLDLISVLS